MSEASEKSIFLHAASLASADERRAYLDEACAADTPMRVRIDALLTAHDRLGGDAPPTNSLESEAANPDQDIGAVLGDRFKLLEVVGEGGMGTVWMAQQSEPVRRVVAVKLIKAGMDTKGVLARFEAERQALALMDHPNIAKVHDGGVTADGRPYFVMELVKGVPITRYCDEHHLTPRQRLELFVPVCHAIQHAHQKGIIHRDIKPSNVLVAMYDDRPVPKVIDFGVAKATGPQLTEQTLHTGFGAVVGTIEYMSPEQASFNQLDVDTRSDIYSLGVLLYELLAGSPPFSKKDLEKAGMLEMLRVIREQEPSKPSTKLSSSDALPSLSANRGTEPSRLTRLVRGELDWIVMKALEKDRGRRYETANGFAMDVQRYLADEAVQACPPSAWYRFGKFARRNKSWVAVAGVVLSFIALLGGTIGWTIRDRVARREEAGRQASESLTRARKWTGENKLALARQELAEAKGRIGDDRSALHNLAQEIEALEIELDKFERFLTFIDQAHQAEFSETDKPVLRNAGKAVPFLLQALSFYDVMEMEHWLDALPRGWLEPIQILRIRTAVYETLLWLADDVVRRQHDHRSGRKILPQDAAKASLAYLRKADGIARAGSTFYRIRALCLNLLGEEDGARADEELHRQTPPAIALDHYLLGLAALDARNKAEVVKQCESALRLEPTHYRSLLMLGCCLGSLGQQDHDFRAAVTACTGCIMKRPEYAPGYFLRGYAYWKLKGNNEALADFSKAIELDPTFAPSWFNRGVQNQELGQLDKALTDFAKAIQLNPRYADAWAHRGTVYKRLAQWDKALAAYSIAMDLDPMCKGVWVNRGYVYQKMGRLDKALADFTKAVELFPIDVDARNSRGIGYCNLGQLDKALADFSKAIELNPMLVLAWSNRGQTYFELNQLSKAIADFSKAIELDSKYASARNNRAVVYGKMGEWDKALIDYSKAIELNPKLALGWCGRGWVHTELGQLDKALADLAKAMELDPKLAQTWSNRSYVHHKQGQWNKALADASKAIELDPKLAMAWSNRGLANQNLGQPEKALFDYSKAIELDPLHLPAWYNRADLYVKLGQSEKALADFTAAIKLTPRDGNLHNNFAWLLATCPDPKFRDPARAVELATKATEIVPKAGVYWNTLGVAQYRAGDWSAAKAALEKSMAFSNGGSSADWFFLAMVYWKLDQKEEARRWYDRAAQWMDKNNPRNDELRRFREEASELLEVKNRK